MGHSWVVRISGLKEAFGSRGKKAVRWELLGAQRTGWEQGRDLFWFGLMGPEDADFPF